MCFYFTDKVAEKSGGSGGNFGFEYDTDQWKILEFDTKENAYALCEFIGNLVKKSLILNTNVNQFCFF